MPKDYEVAGDTLVINLPGEPAASVTGIAYETWPIQTAVEAAAQQVTDKGMLVRNWALHRDTLLRAWAADEDTRGYVRNRRGELVPFNAECVSARDTRFSDLLFIADRVGFILYPDLYADPNPKKASADPNVESDPPQNGHKKEDHLPSGTSQKTKTSTQKSVPIAAS